MVLPMAAMRGHEFLIAVIHDVEERGWGYPVVGGRHWGRLKLCALWNRRGRQADERDDVFGSRICGRGKGEGCKHVERLEETGSGTCGTAGRGATPDARPAWDRARSRQKLAEDGRGGCVTRAGRGVGWVWLGVGEGSSCSTDNC